MTASTPSTEPVLAARGLVRRYGRLAVLAGVDLDLPAGAGLLLVGANGAGKSTLLRALAGLLRPDAGSVRVTGLPVREARGAVGYLGHDSLLYDDLTVAENLSFTARLFGRDPRHAVPAALARVALEAHAAKPVRQLSRGLLQRAALARALLHAPALLLLDEPYTGLDAPSARRLTETLAALRADGTTFVVVSHAPAEAWDAVDRAAVLHRGGWAWQGPRPDHPDLLEARYREARDG